MKEAKPAKALLAVVDDDESVRESLPDLLRELGFSATAFASAKDFLDSDLLGKTACLILDVAMPDMSGPELKQELENRGHRIPTIFITAHPDAVARPEVQAAAACLIKPFSDTALQEVLKEVLKPEKGVKEPVGEMSMHSIAPRDHIVKPSPLLPEKPFVFVVDDDISVRESLELLIRHEGWQPLLFETAQEFLRYPPPSFPNCLVLDVYLPDLNGLDLQERIAAHRAAMPIIFLSGHGDVPMTVRAMKAGAVEFLTKPFKDEALLSAIRGAIEQSRAALQHQAGKQLLRERFVSLSPRERDVMTLIVKGLLNKQVGAELGISEITVKAHRGKVMQKMQAHSFAELVNMWAEIGVALPRS